MATKAVEKTDVSRDDFAEISTFAEAAAILNDAGIGIVDISDYGDGFKIVDKADLVKKDFIVLDSQFKDGDMGEYVIITGMTRDNQKFVFADGSTGIKDQMKELHEKGRTKGIYVEGGLVRSDYEYEDDKGKKIPATTFYFNGM
jgi:hypothetical protein